MTDPFAEISFRGSWRHYQRLALDAFERDRERGHDRTHVVAPPGSGKTLMGLEMARRLGRPAVVLAPNSAVQGGWLRAAMQFGAPPGLAAAEPEAPLACLTYQALCRLDDPADALGELAERRWAEERATATGMTPAEARAEAAGWAGAAAERRARELRSITSALKKEIARAEHGALHLRELLAPSVRERVDVLRANGVATVVLDECHHLASLWGYVVRAVVEELGDVHLIGLTATPPGELTRDESELYAALLGDVDFTVPTPAVVREGHLAPFQELAWLTAPLDSERSWLREHDARFQELVTALHEDASGPLSFPAWVIERVRERGRGGEDAATSWASFQRRKPRLARAGARFLGSAGLPAPGGMPRGEGYREPPNLDDWLVLLEDYALGCLRVDPSEAAAERHDQVARALRDLGYNLTRQGIRRGVSDVDRLLTTSAAKAIGLVEVIACEYDARGDGMRALVLTDAEQAARRDGDELLGVLRPDAGTAPVLVAAIATDLRTAPLRPLLVSGRGLRCAPRDAEPLLEALARAAAAREPSPAVPQIQGLSDRQTGDIGRGLGGWRAEDGGDGLARLVAAGPDWAPRLWVELATRAFTAGDTRALVGTRALLGEGWDAPCVNCVVDMTAATTAVSVTQMRGRSLRLDPADPDKIASNWDVVCVEPELARGDADYARFVRKHLHLFAATEDGMIEAGPSHVHPALGPFAPPESGEFAEINRSMRERAAAFGAARARWAIGSEYEGAEYETVVVRPREGAATAPPQPETPPVYRLRQRPPALLAGAGGIGAGALALAGAGAVAALPVMALPAAAAWAAVRLAGVRRELQAQVPLDLVAFAVRDAYLELGELSPRAAASLAIEPRSSGYLRLRLRSGSEEESARFAQALDDVLEPDDLPRYLVSRLVPGSRGPAALVTRVLTRRPPFECVWEAVPADLGRLKARAEVFARAWQRWLGPGELVFTQREGGRGALAEASAQARAWDVRRRRIWA